MKITKFVAFSIAALISVLLSGSAQAQTGAFVSFKGLEISTAHEESGEGYGWMCFAKTSGALPGNLTLSMNYQGMKAPSTSSTITGGAWTLPIYSDMTKRSNLIPVKIDSYQGVVFGSVEAGEVIWDKRGTTATVELKLLIRGGTQTMSDIGGTAVLYGTVTYGEKGTATFDGTIYFELK